MKQNLIAFTQKLPVYLACLAFALFGCSKDKCADVKCQNGGTCIDGNCNCINGYTGDRCQNAPLPVAAKTMKITGWNILNFPATKSNGDSWDNSWTGTPPPDIFTRVYSGGTLVSDSEGNRYENVYKSELPKGWTLTSPFETANLSSKITIEMWDYDSLQSNELMGSASFTPSTYSTSKPSSIRFWYGDCSFEIFVIWS